MLKGRTPSLTEIVLNKTDNIRNTPDKMLIASQGVTVRPININRSNVAELSNYDSGARPMPTGNGTVTNDDLQPIQPVYENIPNQVQGASISWILPLMILGGFFAAAKLKKKKKNV